LAVSEQFEVSHIKGAIWVGEEGSDVEIDKIIQDLIEGQDKVDKSCISVVCYCSVRKDSFVVEVVNKWDFNTADFSSQSLGGV
jgi:hypothetical protein